MNRTLQSLVEVVQFIVSTFKASDGQNLFKFQLNTDENDTEMIDQDADTCPGVIPMETNYNGLNVCLLYINY